MARERRNYSDEFKNQMIDDVLKTFDIQRSLSAKGCPYDNAVAEATYKIFKTEFAFNRRFKNFEKYLKLSLLLTDDLKTLKN